MKILIILLNILLISNLSLALINIPEDFATIQEGLNLATEDDTIFVASGVVESSIPDNYYNLSNYPNPFNPTATISFSIRKESKVDISIYNLKDQKIRTLENKVLDIGEHTVAWNGTDNYGKAVSSGLYMYKLTVDGITKAVSKSILLK